MYLVTFPAQSNRASWAFIGMITDPEDNPIDLTGLGLVFGIRDRCGHQIITASTDKGNLTILDVGIFRWFITLDEMKSLCLGTYQTGMTMANADQTVQVFVGPLPIVDGNVP